MSGGTGSVNLMEISNSSHSDPRKVIDRSSSDTLLKVTVEEKIETKEWVLPSSTATGSADEVINRQPVVEVENYFEEENDIVTVNGNASEQQYDLCQDDMFSLDELSAVEDHSEQLVVETTVCTADVVTSMSRNFYEPGLGSSIAGMGPVQSVHITEKDNTNANILQVPVDGSCQGTNGQLPDKGKEDDFSGAVTLNTQSCGFESMSEQELIETSTLEGYLLGIPQVEDVVNPSSDANVSHASGKNDADQLTSIVFEKVDALIGEVPQNELVQIDTDRPTSEVVGEVGVSVDEFPQNELVKIEEMPKAAVDTVESNEKENKEQNNLTHKVTVTVNASEGRSSEDVQPTEARNYANATACGSELDTKCVENGLDTQANTNDVPNAHIDGKDQNESIQLNQVTQPEGLLIQVEAAATTMVVNTEMECQEQPQMAILKEQMSELNEKHLEAPRKELEESIHSQSENIPSAIQTASVEDQQLECKDTEKAPENTPKIISQVSNLQEEIIDPPAEHIINRDGEQSQNIDKLFESLKGRKVSKRFGRKKFLGEVIGYDPASQWFKVLYEDGDEEELEKHELDSILISLDAKSSVSHKRRLSTEDIGHEEPIRSGRKFRKVDTHITPGRPGNNETSRDQTPGSRQSSGKKKGKLPVAESRGKSKSPKANVRKTQKGKRKATSTKKSIEKDTAKKSQSSQKSQYSQTKSQQKSWTKERSSKKEINQDTEHHNQDATRKLKYGSAKKKTSTKSKLKAKDDPKKDKEVETPQVSMTEKAEVDTPGRKRKAISELQDGLSTVSSKRARKGKMATYVESPLERKTQTKMISGGTTELKSEAKEEKAESSVPSSTGKKHGGKSDRGTVLVGRKVKKDFGGKLYGGEIVGYKMFYKVEYEDGDSEDLTWKELESILLPEGENVVHNRNDEQHHESRHSSVKSKGRKKK